ncbi:MAG TPA: hypothetical protein VJL81_11245 [Solirubrobacterales bacterium]|nr:hypothetical protein [Solirubrobacterales bacterium]
MEETPRPWVLTREPWILTTLVLAWVVAIVALSSAAFVHNACFGRFGSEPPERGALVSYCNTINPTHPWFSFTIPPVLVMLIGGYLLRRHGWMALLLAAVLCFLVIADAIVATHLHYGYFGA